MTYVMYRGPCAPLLYHLEQGGASLVSLMLLSITIAYAGHDLVVGQFCYLLDIQLVGQPGPQNADSWF